RCDAECILELGPFEIDAGRLIVHHKTVQPMPWAIERPAEIKQDCTYHCSKCSSNGIHAATERNTPTLQHYWTWSGLGAKSRLCHLIRHWLEPRSLRSPAKSIRAGRWHTRPPSGTICPAISIPGGPAESLPIRCSGCAL